jgi:uncharacterized protein
MLFPKTVAQGAAFCNREQERKRLKHNIEAIQHTVVVSPRRYGKTSLILRTIEEITWPYAHIDLFLAVDEKKISERFLDGIAKLVAQVIPINVKAIAKIRDFFKSFSVSLIAGNISFELKLASTHPNPITTVKNAIEDLENLLKKYKKHAVIFIDEIQDMVQTTACNEIEAILRFYAQKTQHLAFIFSGSNRKLLQAIFDDRSRPLFKMCDQLNLQRISKQSYQDFLNAAALKKWKQKLPQNCLDIILELTEQHSYYVNYLCSLIWQLIKLPTVEQIKNIWTQMRENEKSNIAMDIDSLSVNQKKLLHYIAAKDLLTNPTAHHHQQTVQLTSRGITQSLKGLTEKYFIEVTPHGISVTDPMLKAILLE